MGRVIINEPVWLKHAEYQMNPSRPLSHVTRLSHARVTARIATKVFAIIVLAFVSDKSLAADPAANFVLHLFTDACLPNTGNPAGVRAFAEQRRLTPVSEQRWLDMFVGPGDGAAWILSAQGYRFALSIRGLSHACAVWAPKANPEDVESGFRALVGIVGRAANAEPQNIKDETTATPAGRVHTLVIGITRPGANGALVFTLLGAENSNQAFQVSLQEALAANRE